MITFDTWHTARHKVSAFEEYKIVNNLLKEFADCRAKDINICQPKFKDCYYNKKWHLEFSRHPIDIYEYSFNCLRVYLAYNHEEVENAKFFRSIDLFFKYLKIHFKLDKREWLDKMYAYAQESDHHKAPTFIKNMDQYFKKLHIMDEMKCLIK